MSSLFSRFMERCYVIEAKPVWRDALPVPSDVLATVKYQGTFPFKDWGSAYGIEWDLPSRGKNSGLFNQVRYFDCLNGRGSFINVRSGNLQVVTERVGLTFEEAWNLKYHQLPEAHEITFVNAPNGGANKFEDINLSGYAVSKLDMSNIVWIEQIEKLNLSFNLLSKWDETLKQSIRQMKSMKCLNLSGNRFLNIVVNNSSEESNFTINKLILTRCMLKYTANWVAIVSFFKELNSLSLSSNEFVDADFDLIESLNVKSLKLLQINDNNFTKIEFTAFNWVSLETLDISSCPLTALQLTFLPKLKALSIENTPLTSSWKLLCEWLHEVDLPLLQSIKLLSSYAIESLDYSTNQLKLGEDDDPIDYDVLLGLLTTKFPKLTKINGTTYTDSQIVEFNLAYNNFATKNSTPKEQNNTQHITISIKFENNATKSIKKLKIRKGVPWYVIHGQICKLWGLKPGSFIIIPEFTATNLLSHCD